MHKTGSINNIVVIEDFISKDKCDSIVASLTDDVIWKSHTQNGIPDKCANNLDEQLPEVYTILKDAMDRLQAAIEHHFGRQLHEGFPGIRKWSEGEFQPVHADGEGPGGEPNEAYIVDYGSVIYLNDGYEGGEIYFPEYGIELKPKPGTVVFFPSNNMYNHGVKPITSGIRYTSAQFWIPTKHLILKDRVLKGLA